MTSIRGFKLNNCKKCGADGAEIRPYGSYHWVVTCGSYCADSPVIVRVSFVLAGRAWNRVN